MMKKSPKTEQEKVKLPALKITRMKIRVRGSTPLIMHAWSEKAKKQIADKQQGKARLKKEAKNPETEYNAARYIVAGKDCFPAIVLKKALMTVAPQADLFKTQAGMAFFIRGSLGDGQFVPIKYASLTMREDPVRVGTISKTADLRYRPQYTGWKAEFVIEFNENVITADELLNLVRLAGFSCGIGEWRPQKGGGDFGRFELDMDQEKEAAE